MVNANALEATREAEPNCESNAIMPEVVGSAVRSAVALHRPI